MKADGNGKKSDVAILNIFLSPSTTHRSATLPSSAERQEPMHVPYVNSSHTASIHLPHVPRTTSAGCTRQT